MQQLTIEHKKPITTSRNQKVETKQELESIVENKREGKGRILATSRRVCRLSNSDTFYVESESSDDIYYFVRYNPSVFEYCSCLDNSTRHIKCKHIWALEYAIRLGTLKDIEKLPTGAKRYPEIVTTKSYEEDDYDI